MPLLLRTAEQDRATMVDVCFSQALSMLVPVAADPEHVAHAPAWSPQLQQP